MSDPKSAGLDGRRESEHVAVLTDGRQDPGLAALINSLFRNGFAGTVWVGWREAGAALFERVPTAVAQRIEIRLVELDTARPLANYKPEFLELVWRLVGDHGTSVSYMDCDVVLGCQWELIRSWLGSGGVAVVEDLPQRTVRASHPLRTAWQSFMHAVGITPLREVPEYVNAGFVGIPREGRPILPIWRLLVEGIERTPEFRRSTARHYLNGEALNGPGPSISEDTIAMMRAFLVDDQDALNMALMASPVPIAAMGPDAMGFTQAMAPILPHALGPQKPWNVGYLSSLARHGRRPTIADDAWWRYSDGPILAQPSCRDLSRRASYTLAKALRRYL